MDLSIVPQDIHYNIRNLGHLIIREVQDSEQINGVYHIKSKERIRPDFLVKFLRLEIPRYYIDQVDPGGTMRMEYPIYAITKGVDHDDAMDTFERADEKLDLFLKNRKKGGS